MSSAVYRWYRVDICLSGALYAHMTTFADSKISSSLPLSGFSLRFFAAAAAARTPPPAVAISHAAANDASRRASAIASRCFTRSLSISASPHSTSVPIARTSSAPHSPFALHPSPCDRHPPAFFLSRSDGRSIRANVGCIERTHRSERFVSRQRRLHRTQRVAQPPRDRERALHGLPTYAPAARRVVPARVFAPPRAVAAVARVQRRAGLLRVVPYKKSSSPNAPEPSRTEGCTDGSRARTTRRGPRRRSEARRRSRRRASAPGASRTGRGRRRDRAPRASSRRRRVKSTRATRTDPPGRRRRRRRAEGGRAATAGRT
eukprot:31365-Pelagococcus_subviridis.AAC.29